MNGKTLSLKSDDSDRNLRFERRYKYAQLKRTLCVLEDGAEPEVRTRYGKAQNELCENQSV